MARSISARSDSFDLKAPFRISRGIKTVAHVITVEVRAEGQLGRGEGIPYIHYGESLEGTLADVDTVRSAVEGGATRADLQKLLPAGAARNAIDCALWDLEARLAGTSVGALGAGVYPPHPVVSAVTIGIGEPPDMAAEARKVAHAPLIKIKVDRRDPQSQIQAVRGAAPAARLIVDPNESWTITDLEALQPLLREARVDLLEQPLPVDADDGLMNFKSCVPICADESAHITADLAKLAGRYQYVNIKLDKTGGLTEAIAMAAAARAQGFGLMLGCMVCSSLSIAPAMQLAGDMDFVDLDGPLWLASDYPDGVVDKAGILHPSAPHFWGRAI